MSDSRRSLRMKRGDTGPAQNHQQQPPEVGREAERREKDTRNGRSKHREHPTMKPVREVPMSGCATDDEVIGRTAENAGLR